MPTIVAFLSGALTMAFLVASGFFLRFWKKTRDRLFRQFALAFFLFALNQVATLLLDPTTDESNYAYILRVAGFLIILAAIVDKNLLAPRGRK